MALSGPSPSPLKCYRRLEVFPLPSAPRVPSHLRPTAKKLPLKMKLQQRRAMALTHRFRLLFLAAVLAGLASASASASPSLSVSRNVFPASAGSTGRSLLQNKIGCPVGFESQNYTIITSKCRAPLYPPTECCDAFKKFACPFATYLNNRSTDCAETMLTYIYFHGSYPAGLFSAQCLKGKQGVSCEGIPGIDTGVPSAGRRAHGISRPLIALLCGLGGLLFHWVLPCTSP
ncbi:GPI-anchored protein LLG1-like [Hordeum vulgare subsp. vulgare]|nr:GPI-anchored protein LLG1-like [Hordeum vulgare subsp. vulgare]